MDEQSNLHVVLGSGPLGLAVARNGRTRARIAEALMRAHEVGRIGATIGRGSDFFGPHAHTSTVGDRVFARVVTRGRPRCSATPMSPTP